MGVSSGRIIDNAGRRLPIGIEPFERVVDDFAYVDKSPLGEAKGASWEKRSSS